MADTRLGNLSFQRMPQLFNLYYLVTSVAPVVVLGSSVISWGFTVQVETVELVEVYSRHHSRVDPDQIFTSNRNSEYPRSIIPGNEAVFILAEPWQLQPWSGHSQSRTTWRVAHRWAGLLKANKLCKIVSEFLVKQHYSPSDAPPPPLKLTLHQMLTWPSFVTHLTIP